MLSCVYSCIYVHIRVFLCINAHTYIYNITFVMHIQTLLCVCMHVSLLVISCNVYDRYRPYA